MFRNFVVTSNINLFSYKILPLRVGEIILKPLNVLSYKKVQTVFNKMREN